MTDIVCYRVAELLSNLDLISIVSSNYEYGYDSHKNATAIIMDIVYPAPTIWDGLFIIKDLGLWVSVDYFNSSKFWMCKVIDINSKVDAKQNVILKYEDRENKYFYDAINAYHFGMTWALEYLSKQKNQL
jgi:PKD repeat protein